MCEELQETSPSEDYLYSREGPMFPPVVSSLSFRGTYLPTFHEELLPCVVGSIRHESTIPTRSQPAVADLVSKSKHSVAGLDFYA